MDTLVALGSSAAFLYSVFILIVMTRMSYDKNVAEAAHYLHEFYFEAAAMILALISVD
jgi:Cu2+-exporting ATPase